MGDNKEMMEETYDSEFTEITAEYLRASEALANAAGLAASDPIKQDMIAFIQEDFVKMCARSEGIRLMAEQSYVENRDFILSEMKEVTAMNLKMVEQIKNKIKDI